MSVFARSDVASVALSASHGGCGRVHTRPAPGGEPSRVWELTCAQCEDTLRHDPLWSSSASSIPETPDEVTNRLANEKRTATEQAAKNVEVMEKLGNMPEALAQALIALMGHGSPSSAPCPEGHENSATARFCGECGASMAQEAPPQPAEPVSDEVPTEEPRGFLKGATEPEGPDLDSMSLGELKKLATSYGVPTRRSKEDQIAVLRDHLER